MAVLNPFSSTALLRGGLFQRRRPVLTGNETVQSLNRGTSSGVADGINPMLGAAGSYSMPSSSIGASIAPTLIPGKQEVFPPIKPQFQDIYLEPVRPRVNSPQQALNDALRQRDAQGAQYVDARKQEQLERGVGGVNGDGRYYPQDPSAVAGQLNSRVPASQLTGFRKPDAGSIGNTKVVPGIGHVTQVQQSNAPGYGNVMTGRYGTGSATFGDKPPTGGTVTENGKTTALAPWFQDAARRQGESNQFFNKEGRKIVPDKA